MREPTETQARELIRQLKNTNWVDLETKLVDAITRNFAGTQWADGYSSNTLGGRSTSEFTSVESAAHRRIYGRSDAHHHHLVRASGALAHAVADVNTVLQHLADIELLGTPAVVDANECAVCKTADIHTPWEHFGDVNGVLTAPVHMCASCLKFVSKHRRQPTVDELRSYHDTGYWGRAS